MLADDDEVLVVGVDTLELDEDRRCKGTVVLASTTLSELTLLELDDEVLVGTGHT